MQPDVSRRPALAAAVLGRAATPPGADSAEGGPLRVIAGEILDVSPHLIILERPDGVEERLVVAPWATAWRGAPIPAGDLRAGSQVIIRTRERGRVVEAVWADISRVNGVILDISGGRGDRTIEVDCGPHRGRRTVTVPYRSSGRIQVRHPKLEPGYLLDVICVREDGEVSARLPATSQPTYRASDVPPATPSYGGVPKRISGTVTWFDGFEEEGAAYPMLERGDAGCAGAGVSCAGLPYLAIGSRLHVGNVCSGLATTVPIVECGCVTGLFCDRCVQCGTSPRGRVADLTAVSFVALGGDLAAGCFNARIGMG
ncbi:hypothetical protein [Bailinhaonella thermotolerans]|uniref:Uncharacterized protein n=1 Tax=Bailinhaonella thermotolerans TaxID=1070861 RepID=A0A3A4ARN7_9ACTN|nr:hypothetical protein [Bailinhaonella thermotolerans]RJL22115.1 hypothetical protein D5H75_36620 [Bailinhaonella thermotolerans]